MAMVILGVTLTVALSLNVAFYVTSELISTCAIVVKGLARKVKKVSCIVWELFCNGFYLL